MKRTLENSTARKIDVYRQRMSNYDETGIIVRPDDEDMNILVGITRFMSNYDETGNIGRPDDEDMNTLIGITSFIPEPSQIRWLHMFEKSYIRIYDMLTYSYICETTCEVRTELSSYTIWLQRHLGELCYAMRCKMMIRAKQTHIEGSIIAEKPGVGEPANSIGLMNYALTGLIVDALARAENEGRRTC